jgi:membrane-associated PAP2 superfamily phosphatase
MTSPAFEVWWRHVRWPLYVFVPIALVLATTDLDLDIARALFFDSAHGHWRGADSVWVTVVLHTGGRWAVRVLVFAAIVAWAATFVRPAIRTWRRPLVYFIIATVLGVGIVGLLKVLTNVDCPWDLQPFGGAFPFVHLFADRPDALRRAACFPAAHASSGYALLALYFVWRERDERRARLGLALGIAMGCLFGVAQQARGAHFLSHDLWSAFIVWTIAASVYAFGFKACLVTPALTSDERCVHCGSRIAPAAHSRASDRIGADPAGVDGGGCEHCKSSRQRRTE